MAIPLLRFPFVLLCLGATIAQAPPPIGRTVEDVLPASTYAVVRFGGLTACSEAASALPMTALVETFLSRVPADVRAARLERGLDVASQHLRRVVETTGLGVDDARALLARPMALAVGRLSIEGMGPSVALVIDQGNSAGSISRCMNAVAERVAGRNGAPVGATVDVEGIALRHLVSAAGVPIFFGPVDGWFVVTNSRGYLQDLVRVVRGGGQGLAASSRLADLRAALPSAPLASVFLNTASLVRILDAHLPYEAADFADALGIGHLDSVYAAMGAAAHGGDDVLHIGLCGSEKGALKALLAQPADLGFAAMCSQNTVAFAAGSLDGAAVVSALGKFVALLPAPAQNPLREAMAGGLQHGLGMPGRSLDAILRAFGSQVSLALSFERSAVPKPELLLRLQVNDRAAVAELMQRLEARVAAEGRLEWKSRPVGDREIRFCNVPLANAGLQLTPCYVLLDHDLVCGSDTAALVRALRQLDKSDTSLAAQPDFRQMAGEVTGAGGVLHLRLFRAAEIGWPTIESWGYPQLDAHMDEIGFGSDALPDAEALAGALGTSTFAYRVGADGIEVRNHGTLALGQAFAAFGKVADEVLRRGGAKVY